MARTRGDFDAAVSRGGVTGGTTAPVEPGPVGPPPATTAQGGSTPAPSDRERSERRSPRGREEAGDRESPATEEAAPTQPTQPPAPGRLQDDPRFREMTRAWQLQVERGNMSLEQAYAAWQKEGSIREGPGGGVGPPGASAGGGGGGGGGGAGGGFGGQPSAYGAGGTGGDSVEALIEKQFRGILSGEFGSFTQKKEDILLAQLRSEGRAKAASLRAQADRDAVQRGLYRSDIALKRYREIDLEIEKQISDGEQKIRLARAEAEFNDKMKALDMAQKWLDSRRQYELGKEQIAAQREATQAQLALGYAQIAANKEIAQMQASAAGAGVRAQLQMHREEMDFKKMVWAYEHGVEF
jgi:hypothetical protein